MFTKTLATTLAILIGLSAAASAASIDQRERWQARRIYNGIQSGKLTFNEARALVRGQMRIHAMEAQARADGFIDPWERAQIQARQNQENARIWIKKHN